MSGYLGYQDSTQYIYNCIPIPSICVNNVWIVVVVFILSALFLLKKHAIKAHHAQYQNQIEQLKLQNELLSLKSEYESHKHTNEKTLNELRQHNHQILGEIALLRDNGSKSGDGYEPERKLSKQEEAEVHKEIDFAKMKRHRFGELRRSLSSSSIPSEHDEDIIPYLANKIFDVTTTDRSDTAPSSPTVFDYVNSCPTPTNKSQQNNFDFLRIPEITVTDTISFNNYENISQHSSEKRKE